MIRDGLAGTAGTLEDVRISADFRKCKQKGEKVNTFVKRNNGIDIRRSNYDTESNYSGI